MKRILILLTVFSLLLCALAAADSFTGTGEGRNGPVPVTLTMDGGVITAVEIGENAETAGIATPALEQIPQAIVDAQSIAVDVVSGATLTSNAILAGAEQALAAAGLNPDDYKTAPEKAVQEDAVLDADVVVAGAGGAGLSAAVTAAEAGAKVVVLEKTSFALGATGMSAGAIAAGARDTDPEGTYTRDQLYDFWMWIADGKTDAAVTRKIADMSTDSINWLENMGLAWKRAMTGFFGVDILMVAGDLADEEGHLGSAGGMIIDTLKTRADELGVVFCFDTPATAILTDGDRVTGIVGTRADGSTVTVNAKAVVLATGDFFGDVDKMREIRPDVDKVVLYGHAANTGDGIRMAVEIGAKESYGAEVAKGCYGTGGSRLGTYKIGMTVNAAGERFVDEAVGYGPYYTALRAQQAAGNDVFWEIFDSATPYTADLEADYADGTIVKADTLEELAAAIGVDAAGLAATAAAYDAEKGQTDSQFGKMAEFMFGMSEGPFYATTVYPLALGSYGGLEIDTEARILKADGGVFENLYGAGDVVLRSFMVDTYPYSGTCLQYAVSTGRIAGANAAK